MLKDETTNEYYHAVDFYSRYRNSMFRYLSICCTYPYKNKYHFFVIGFPLVALRLYIDNKSKLQKVRML